MTLLLSPMTRAEAKTIYTWQYPAPYGLYSFSKDEETLEELLCGDYYAAFSDGGELCGYICYGQSAVIPARERDAYKPGYLDIGLGLSPERCGKGQGIALLYAGLQYGMEAMGAEALRLTVLQTNHRAIKVYTRAGFVSLKTIHHEKTGFPFMVMVKENPFSA